MVAKLELVVRPFQTPVVRVPGLAVGPALPDPDVVTLQCGDPEGVGKTFTESASSSVTAFVETKEREVSRTVVPVRVKNPDDLDQHVDIDVTTSLKVARKDGDKVTRAEQKFADVVKTDTTEILGGSRKIDDTKKATDGWPNSW